MKIIIVSPYFYPKVGGLEDYVFNLVQGLKNDNSILVITTNHMSTGIVEENIKGIRVIRLPILFKFANTPINPLWVWEIKRIIKLEKPDLINVHTPVPGISDIVIMSSGNTPTIFTIHAATFKKPGFMLFNIVELMYRVIFKYILKKVDAIIVVPEYVKKSLPEKFLDKVEVVNNAIDLSIIPKKDIQYNKYQLIFIGSLDKSHSWKGLSDILIAVSIVKKKYKKVKLVILGDGDMKEFYESQAEQLDIVNNFNFI